MITINLDCRCPICDSSIDIKDLDIVLGSELFISCDTCNKVILHLEKKEEIK